jgi:hypothetical protein
MHRYDEPLEISAALAWQLASAHCRRDPATGVTCAWNHGLWQVLRLLGLVGTAARRGDFYRREIARAAGDGAFRILISGTSDTAMLALAAQACAGRAVAPDITVIDICDTPLRLNRWYAEQHALPVACVRTDFLDYDPAQPFDLVCTDSFLGRFPHAQWPRVAARWHALLRPGGTLLTASKLAPDSHPGQRIAFSAGQAAAFRDAVRARMLEPGAPAGLDPDLVTQAAAQYAQYQCNHPLRSAGDMQALLENAGFAITRLTPYAHTAGHTAGIQAPSMAADTTFLQVVAVRA